MSTAGRTRTRRGLVTEFDADAGLGVVRSADGSDHAFHCVQIADGSRVIAVGTDVHYVVLDRLGRHEAGDLTPCRSGDDPVMIP